MSVTITPEGFSNFQTTVIDKESGNNVTNRTIPWAVNGACAVRRSVVGMNTDKANLLLKSVGHPPDLTNKLALSLTHPHFGSE
ncbi:hypothetical protein AG0111_0g5929 [Alternaria gaisen]|uniref:Uncharacterized protein n=1 Tax=Alternaria gaisen TaxID=167740 RepID=A0ACB6FLS7_9PLEO|nr:hypothetical protein AG0111_0g5929 [Alternaria gaisen]